MNMAKSMARKSKKKMMKTKEERTLSQNTMRKGKDRRETKQVNRTIATRIQFRR